MFYRKFANFLLKKCTNPISVWNKIILISQFELKPATTFVLLFMALNFILKNEILIFAD